MDESRRRFLKVAGCSLLGAAAGVPAMRAVAKASDPGHSEPKGGDGKKGPQWAMVIDTRRCLEQSGCTKCIDACHVSHNVPQVVDDQGKVDKLHEVKWVWKEERFEHAFPEQHNPHLDAGLRDKPVLVMCNHCESPPCVRVCPTQATFKRPDGIVMMDMHRCIGCRYCIAACPYGSRSFNWKDPRPFIKPAPVATYPTRTTGVVGKCTFCDERLAKGLPPACVEACDEGANGSLTFGDLADPSSKVAELLRGHFSIRRKPGLGTGPQVFYIV